MFNIKELIEVTEARKLNDFKIDDNKTFFISTDTRAINQNNVYLPLVGEKFDGHSFIENAIKNSDVEVYFTNNEKYNFKNALGLLVKDTKEAYLKLAKYYKDKINPITIAVTGSCGKTTTKEMLYSVLSQKYKTHKTKLNHNNEIGFAQTIFSLKPDVQILIVEMGMRGLNEIDLIVRYANPNYSIITNVLTAHIGRLGSRENIAKAKCEVTHCMKEPKTAIVNNDPLILENITDKNINVITFDINSPNLKIISQEESKSVFEYKNNLYKLNIEGIYNIQNALSAIELGLILKLSPKEIANGLEEFKPFGMRWNVEKYNDNKLTIVNDCYNANPDSMKAAIKTFFEIYKNKKNVLVLGDMGELGENEIVYHRELGEFLNNFEFDTLITIGHLAKNINIASKNKNKIHFNDLNECKNYIFDKIKEGNVLIKASRSMEFEKLTEGVTK